MWVYKKPLFCAYIAEETTVFTCSNNLESFYKGSSKNNSVCMIVSLQLRELHKQGGDLCVQDSAGRTLLHHAVNVASKEIVRYIIDNGEIISYTLTVQSISHNMLTHFYRTSFHVYSYIRCFHMTLMILHLPFFANSLLVNIYCYTSLYLLCSIGMYCFL